MEHKGRMGKEEWGRKRRLYKAVCNKYMKKRWKSARNASRAGSKDEQERISFK